MKKGFPLPIDVVLSAGVCLLLVAFKLIDIFVTQHVSSHTEKTKESQQMSKHVQREFLLDFFLNYFLDLEFLNGNVISSA